MKSVISNLISKLSAFLGFFRLKQISVVALAGFLLLSTVACNPSSPSAVGTGSYHERIAQPTNDKTYQPSDRLDSYNEYDDVQSSKALKAKTRAVVDRAKRNTNEVQGLGDLVDEIKSGAPNPAEDAGQVIDQATSRAARDAKAGFRNLQGNLDRAGQTVQETAEDTAQNAQRNLDKAGREASNTVRRNADNAADFVKDKADNSANAVRSRT
jgi:hypothetical protein